MITSIVIRWAIRIAVNPAGSSPCEFQASAGGTSMSPIPEPRPAAPGGDPVQGHRRIARSAATASFPMRIRCGWSPTGIRATSSSVS